MGSSSGLDSNFLQSMAVFTLLGTNPPAKLGPSRKAQEGRFEMLDLGLSTTQLNIQSCFKQCGRANLLKGLTQPCCPQGRMYGRAVNSSRAALVTAQPCVGFAMCPCVLQFPSSPLSADLLSRYSVCRRWIRSCGYRADPRAGAWCAAPRCLPAREIWNFEGGGGRRRSRVFSGKAKP